MRRVPVTRHGGDGPALGDGGGEIPPGTVALGRFPDGTVALDERDQVPVAPGAALPRGDVDEGDRRAGSEGERVREPR